MERTITTGIPNVDVTVDENGTICLDGRALNQLQARNVAAALVKGIRYSIDRTQIGTKHYTDTENILARSNSPIGQALTALAKIF